MMFIPEGKGLMVAGIVIGAIVLFAISPKNAGAKGSVLISSIGKTVVALIKSVAAVWAGFWAAAGLLRLLNGTLGKILDDAKVDSMLKALFTKVPMAGRVGAGDEAALLEMAQKRFPPSKYPTLYAKEIPEDLRRSPVADGRLINGEEIGAYAPAFISKAHQGAAFRAAIIAFAVWFPLLLLVWHPSAYFRWNSTPAINARVVESVEAAKVMRRDFWSASELEKARGDARVAASSERSKAAAGVKAPSFGSGGLLTVLLGSLFLALAAWRSNLRRFLDAGAGKLLTGTKEQIVRFNYRREARDNEYSTYCEQVKRATGYDRTPMISIALEATGTFRKRGKLDSPYKGQRMLMSLMDFHQNMLVIGGTGSGKTRSVVIPIAKQLLDIRKTEMARAVAGALDAIQLSMYVTDGKAVLYHDIAKIAQDKGQFGDLLVLGCDETKGEYSVDLLDGVSPQLLADGIKSVSRQSGGESQGESIWPDMAAEVIRNNGVVARAFDRTEWGVDWRVRNGGERPYSLVFIYQLAVDGGKMLSDCIDAILWTLENDYDRLADIANVELFDAMDYLVKTWVGMVDATRDGIKINITQSLGPFASNITLRKTFASGAGVNLANVRDFWGRIVCTNISTLEYGVAGRIINVFLKTLLMTEAVRREQTVKAEVADIETRLARLLGVTEGKTSPRDLPAAQLEKLKEKTSGKDLLTRWNLVSTKLEREKMFIIGDEYQTLITVDTKEGSMSDSNFWNVSRSSGCAGILLTQSTDTLEQAIGKVAADNFLKQMRSKIVLLVEDHATTDYIKKLSGKEMRFHTFDENRHESYDSMLHSEHLADPVMSGEEAARTGIGAMAAQSVMGNPLDAVKPFNPVDAVKSREAQISVDTAGVPVLRETGNWQGGLSSNIDAVQSAEQQAKWRAEDMRHKDLSEGTQEADVFTENDFTSFGQNLAFAYIQRAGKTRQDIVRLY